MNNTQFIKFLMTECDVSHEKAQETVSKLLSKLTHSLVTLGKVKIGGLGTLQTTPISRFSAYNINTKKREVQPAHHRCSFKAHPKLKQALKTKSSSELIK